MNRAGKAGDVANRRDQGDGGGHVHVENRWQSLDVRVIERLDGNDSVDLRQLLAGESS